MSKQLRFKMAMLGLVLAAASSLTITVVFASGPIWGALSHPQFWPLQTKDQYFDQVWKVYASSSSKAPSGQTLAFSWPYGSFYRQVRYCESEAYSCKYYNWDWEWEEWQRASFEDALLIKYGGNKPDDPNLKLVYANATDCHNQTNPGIIWPDLNGTDVNWMPAYYRRANTSEEHCNEPDAGYIAVIRDPTYRGFNNKTTFCNYQFSGYPYALQQCLAQNVDVVYNFYHGPDAWPDGCEAVVFISGNPPPNPAVDTAGSLATRRWFDNGELWMGDWTYLTPAGTKGPEPPTADLKETWKYLCGQSNVWSSGRHVYSGSYILNGVVYNP